MVLGVEKVIVTGLPPLPVSSTPVNWTTTCGAPSAGGASATDSRIIEAIGGGVLELPPPHAARPSAITASHGKIRRSWFCRHIPISLKRTAPARVPLTRRGTSGD